MENKAVTLPRLIEFVLSFANDNTKNDDNLEKIFMTNTKSNDEFVFNSLKQNESKNINDFPKRMKTIFDPFIKDFIRHGSRINYENDANISFYYSVLSIIVKDFKKMDEKVQLNYIMKLRDKLILYVSQNNNYDNYGWFKKEIHASLIQFKVNKIVIKIMADYLNVNIFLINIFEDNIYSISENDSYDMFRLNMFVAFNDNVFEPLIYNNSPLLPYNSILVKKLISVDKHNIIPININIKDDDKKQFIIKLSHINVPENIKIETVELVNNYDEIVVTESDANFNAETIEDKKVPITVSDKMKLSKLQEIATSLDIPLQKKGKGDNMVTKTKSELIQDISKTVKKN